jgi:hypothetical protein
VRVTVTDIAPLVVITDSQVQVTGVITNTSTEAIGAVSVRLQLLFERLGARPDVDGWLDGTDQRAASPLAVQDVLGTSLQPGASLPFTLRLNGSELGLRYSEFGVYGIAVEARGAGPAGGRESVGLTRSVLEWQPTTKEYEAQQIAWLVPLTASAQLVQAASGRDAAGRPDPVAVAALVGPGTRMRRLLDAAGAPGVTWAVDPALLTLLDEAASTTGAGAEPAPTTPSSSSTTAPGGSATTSGGTAAADLAARRAAARTVIARCLADLRTAATGRQVIELPYGDPDLVPLHSAGADGLLADSVAAGAGTIADLLGVQPVLGVAVPPDGWADDATLTGLAARGVRTLVTSDVTRPLATALTYTPDARTTRLPSGLVGLVSDSQLDRLAMAPTPGNRRRLLAETAAATSERPGLARRLLVALPRDANPDPRAFRALVSATTRVPWLGTVPVSALLSPAGRGDTSQLVRRAVPPTPAAQGIRVADVRTAQQLRRTLSAVGEMVADPGALTGTGQREGLLLLSAAWRGHRSALAAVQQRQRVAVDAVSGRVRVLPATITFLRSDGQLRLTVANDLGTTVTGLRLKVTSSSPRLAVRQATSAPLDLDTGTLARVEVPVLALASGVVELRAQLVSPSGLPVGQEQDVRVRVRPSDGNLLTVIGGLVALVLVVGLVRAAVRRPRRRAAEGEA